MTFQLKEEMYAIRIKKMGYFYSAYHYGSTPDIEDALLFTTIQEAEEKAHFGIAEYGVELEIVRVQECAGKFIDCGVCGVFEPSPEQERIAEAMRRLEWENPSRLGRMA